MLQWRIKYIFGDSLHPKRFSLYHNLHLSLIHSSESLHQFSLSRMLHWKVLFTFANDLSLNDSLFLICCVVKSDSLL